MNFAAKYHFQQRFGGNWYVEPKSIWTTVAPAELGNVTEWLNQANISYRLRQPKVGEGAIYPHHRLTLLGDPQSIYDAITQAIAQGATPPKLFQPPHQSLT